MARKTYSEKLKDPRWQKVRLQKLESANWECENCGCADQTLHVHHKFYKRGKEPWEYEPDDLEVLCKNCHDDFHDRKEEIDYLLGHLGPAVLETILGMIRAAHAFDAGEPCQVNSYEEAIGVVLNCLSNERTVDDVARSSLSEKLDNGTLGESDVVEVIEKYGLRRSNRNGG